MDRYLIINADDFGMCRGANLAVMELLKNEKSALTSSTIMAPCAWAPEACRFAAENPELAIGVHLTLTSEWSKYRWAPVNAEHTASLRDEEGYMWHESDQVEEHVDLDEVEGEIRAQIERCKRLGLTNPSHLDNHMGSLYGIETGRFELLELTLSLAGEYGLPFRFPGSFTEAQFNNTMLDINIDKSMIEMVFGKVVAFAKQQGVAIPITSCPMSGTSRRLRATSSSESISMTCMRASPRALPRPICTPPRRATTSRVRAAYGSAECGNTGS